MDVTDDVYFDFYTILKNVFLCTRGSMKIKDEQSCAHSNFTQLSMVDQIIGTHYVKAGLTTCIWLS